MRLGLPRWLVIASLLLGTACGDDTSPADGGPLDAGETDAGETDAGETDAGETDAGETDAGETDAGETDAGETDAGERLCSIPGGTCDIAAQDCPEGQACYVTTDGTELSVSCSVLADLGGEGDSCLVTAECRPGFTCRAGACRRYCCPEGGLECPRDRECVRYFEAPNLGHCLPITECDPVTSDGCSPSQGCYMGPSPGTLGCFGAGTRVEGQECAANNHCAPGMFCLGAGPFECMRACHTSNGNGDCTTAGHTCREVPSLLPAGIGICAPPD